MNPYLSGPEMVTLSLWNPYFSLITLVICIQHPLEVSHTIGLSKWSLLTEKIGLLFPSKTSQVYLTLTV